MERDAFTTEFTRRLRFVLQKHEREIIARADLKESTVIRSASVIDTNYLAAREAKARGALEEANTNLDAAIGAFADYMLDLITTPVSPLPPAPSSDA
jgi:uncharacterized membrane protein